MHLDPFELHRPSTVDETVALAGRLAGTFDYLAGGTDLLPNYKMHLNLRPHLIALEDIEELRGLGPTRIGAMARLADVEAHVGIARVLPAVVQAAREIATPLVRASGTLGGNLLLETRCFFFNQTLPWRESLGYCLKADGDQCHVVPQKVKCYATFSGDLAPALMVLGAEVEVAGASGRRRFPLAALYDAAGDGIRRTHLAPGELLIAVHIPAGSARLRSAYRKLRMRPSFDFPELGIGASARFDGDRVTEVHLSAGGLETSPLVLDDLASELVGQSITPERAASVGERVRAKVRPVHNTSMAPDYRKRMAGVFVKRALLELAVARDPEAS
jgi:4-hydroxybenzoyl-CoA reductase subunit beta